MCLLPDISIRHAFQLSILALLLWSIPALAQQPLVEHPPLPDMEPSESIDVVISPSAKELDPVAIPDARCQGSATACKTIVDVLRNDLTITGFFRVVTPSTYIGNIETEPLDSPKWADWFNVGAKYLIKVDVKEEGGALTLQFRLFNVVDKEQITTRDHYFSGVAPRSVRGKAHAFANAVILALTGIPGPFKSKIVFSKKTGLWTRGIFRIDIDGHGLSSIVSDENINSFPSFARGKIAYTVQPENTDPIIYLGKEAFSKSPFKFRKAVMGPDKNFAVSVDTGEGTDIWLMDSNGKLTRNLTKGEGDNVNPSWSRGGSRIVFTSNRSGNPQIYIMNADGTHQRRLTMAGAYNSTPNYGPDGTVVFAGMDEGRSDLFTVDRLGHIQRLTQGQGSNYDPVWSPDGRWIAFISTRNGRKIWIMTSDGRYQFPVTKNCTCATPDWGR